MMGNHFNLRKTSLLLVFFFNAIIASAQTTTVKGTIKDANGQALQGASIQLQGTKTGTIADDNGNFSLNVAPGNYTLIVSFAGYVTERTEILVNTTGIADLNIMLKNAADLSNITVVGSRNLSRTRVETPVPVDVIPISQVINDIGQVDINQILNFIAPSFQSARQTIADGTDHVDPAQLRGLGTDQVLVLVNGKRRHQSALVNVNGTVNRGAVGTDMSAIPATAIERIEILRDGAAAQYGSDAIAGVINIVLKKKTGLLEANVSYGQYITKYPKNYALYKIQGKTDDPDEKVTDGETLQGSLSYGFGIGKGYLSLTGEYINRKGTNRTGTYTGAIFPNVNGVNRDDSIMGARGLDRNDFDMRVGNSDMKSGAV